MSPCGLKRRRPVLSPASTFSDAACWPVAGKATGNGGNKTPRPSKSAAQAETLDKGLVTALILALEVVKQATTLTDEHQKATT